MVPLLSVELHCHSLFSPDSPNKIDDLILMAERKGIDRLAITDHNTISGAREAKKMAPERIIVGEEIRTQKGELLAYFVQEEIPKGLPPLEAIRLLREQDAFISVSHPFDIGRENWPEADLMEIVSLIDAIEIFNSRCFYPLANRRAQQFAARQGLPGTVGSDAHLLSEIGRSRMRVCPFSNKTEFKMVIREAKVETAMSEFWVHWGSWWARMVKELSWQKPPP